MPAPSYPHYAWAFGHVLVLTCTLYTLLGLATFQSTRTKAYYTSYAGALLSWGIVVYKSLGTPQFNRAYVQRALLDENVQYLLLALYWFLQKPILITMIPFATFSLFHTLTFIRTTVLPKSPSSSSTSSSSSSTPKQPPAPAGGLNKQIQTWVKNNYEKAMLFVSFVEVVGVFGRLVLGAVTFQNGLLSPLLFAHFLRLRYYLSPSTRKAFEVVNGKIDDLIKDPRCPSGVGKGVEVVRGLIIRYSESVLQVSNPNAPAAAAPGAGAPPAPAAPRR